MDRVYITRWIIKGLAFILLVVATCVVLSALIPSGVNTYFAGLSNKHKLLESTPGPRVIVVGGSNVAFGLDSERLAGLLHKTVINDGLHAALGMRFILNDLIPFIHSGDVVVLSPEYANFINDNLEGSSPILGQFLDVSPQALQSFEIPQYVQLSDIYTDMLRSKILRMFDDLISPSKAENAINRQRFNKYGDEVLHLGKPSLKNIDNSAYITIGDSFNPETIKVFNRFARQVTAMGATIVMVYPASRMTNSIACFTFLDQLDTYLRDRLEFPILSHPLDSYFADKYFYDTIYHLNAEGRQLRTDQLAGLLADSR